MDKTANSYINTLTTSIHNQMHKYLRSISDDNLVAEHFTERIKRIQFRKFQEYYFLTVNERVRFFSDKNYFSTFRQKYSLQGADKNFLNNLDAKKNEIINLIDNNKLSELYFEHFSKVSPIKTKNLHTPKNFGSFFTKVVHTFNPSNFTPLDNPIKNYFNLKGESFFIAFIAISSAYKIWSGNNSGRIDNIKMKIIKADMHKIVREDSLTGMKILNMIFWSVADKKMKIPSREG